MIVRNRGKASHRGGYGRRRYCAAPVWPDPPSMPARGS
jgi:hypothetical protein